MAKFIKKETFIKGAFVITPVVHKDDRGFFLESYNKKDFLEIGITDEFVQDNHSRSNRNVLRGLHFQTSHSQGKLIRVINGSIYDVIVDLRRGSETFGKWFGVELSEANNKMLYIPKDFAHGFVTLEDNTDIMYKCTDFYYPEFDSGIIWNDETINVDWKLDEFNLKEEELVFSEKDKKHQTFKEFIGKGE